MALVIQVKASPPKSKSTRIYISDDKVVWSYEKITSISRLENDVMRELDLAKHKENKVFKVQKGETYVFRFKGFKIKVDDEGKIYKNGHIIMFGKSKNVLISKEKIEVGKSPLWEVPQSVIRDKLQ